MSEVMIALDVLSVVIVLIVLWSCLAVPTDERQPQRLFVGMLLVQLMLSVTDGVDWMLNGHAALRTWQYVSNTLNYLAGYVIVWLFIQFICSFAKLTQKGRHYVAIINNAMMLLPCMLLVINLFTGDFFFIDALGVYAEGDLYWVSQAIPTSLLIFSAELIICHIKLGKKMKVIFLSYSLLPVFGIAMDYYLSGYSFTYTASTVSLLIIYSQFFVQRGQMLEQQKNEMIQHQISIMLSQIQPHFLNNSLAVISELAHDKAPEAEQATLEFANFLRGNLDSLKAEKLISFEQELKYTMTYLALEKRRFGDRIHVTSEIQARYFRLPALTLQPIVENAVRYGITKREEGGNIRIRSEEREDNYVITVMDDGIGYDPYRIHSDGRSHIGIENVQKRLQFMCEGTLEISAVTGQGTTVKISLPKEMSLGEAR